MKITAIITAGGTGKRMGKKKQFLPFAGDTIVGTTLRILQQIKKIDEIILVVDKSEMDKAKGLGIKVVAGGEERQDSVANGLKAVSSGTELVVIHDGARPLITTEVIEKAIEEGVKYGAAVVGVPAKDTVKVVGDDLFVEETPDRNKLWLIQTPQVFKYDIITQAHAEIKDKMTDDAGLVERIGVKVKMVMGSYENLKITTPEDIRVAEAILKGRKN